LEEPLFFSEFPLCHKAIPEIQEVTLDMDTILNIMKEQKGDQVD